MNKFTSNIVVQNVNPNIKTCLPVCKIREMPDDLMYNNIEKWARNCYEDMNVRQKIRDDIVRLKY